MGTDINAALKASKAYLKEAQKHKDTLEVAYACDNIGMAHYYLNNIDSAVYYGERSLAGFEILNDSTGMSLALVNLGLAYSYTNNVSRAMESFSRAYQIDTLQGDPSGEVFYYYNIAGLLAWQEKNNEAEKALLKAYQAGKIDTLHEYIIPSIHITYASILREKKQYEQATDSLLKAIKLSRKYKDSLGVTSAFSELSYLNYLQENYELALSQINYALKINKGYGDRYSRSVYFGQKAEIYNALAIEDSAYRYADSSLAIAKQEKSFELFTDAWYVYSQVYEKNGEFEKALEALKKSYAYEDSIVVWDAYGELLNKQSDKTLEKLFDSRLIQQQQKGEIKYQHRWILVLVLLFATGLVLIFLLFRMRKRTQDYNKVLLERNRQILEQRTKLDEKSKELEENNKKLLNLNQSKDRLFSVLSHDLRQPFNQLLASIELLSSGALTREEEVEFLEGLRESVQKTSNMVNNMLVWSKAQFAGVTIEQSMVHLGVLVKKQILQQSVSIERKNIRLTLDTEDVEVFFDENHLRIILRNIMQNAIKFSHKNGEIIISTRVYSDEEALLEIADRGIGMTAEKLAQVRQGTNSISELGTLNEVGFGLGLLISSQFLAENGGRMEVESVLNEGTTFRLYLPRKTK